jgi:DNA repair protein SbcC/Rad50
MIVTRIKLDPFGGKTGTELNFQPGLNVVSGPNEAGKSTVFAAVFAALFVPARLGKRDFEKRIARFLPLGGGDTIRVELDLSQGAQTYRLKKSWGGTAAAELTLPDGTVITEEEAIAERLSPLLGSSEGTYRSVLMTRQAGLGLTLAALESDHRGTVRELDDILRSALLETDGISLDLFREKVDKEYARYFDHWDRKEDYPEQGRGIENPWRKQVGEILRAFYQRENLEKSLEETRRLEAELEAINRRIAEKKESLEAAEEYLSRNRQAVEDARERRVLAGELAGLKALLKNLEEANSDWPVRESRAAELAGDLVEMEKREALIAGERKTAEANEKNRALRERYARAREKKRLLDGALEAREKCPAIDQGELEKIRAAEAGIAKLEAALAAGKLSLKLTAKDPAKITIRRDLSEPREEELASGRTVEFAAGSRIEIDHPQLAIEAAAGERPFGEIAEEYERAKKTHGEVLDKLGLAGLQEAEAALRTREDAEGRVRAAGEYLVQELGEYSYRELEEKTAGLGPAGKTRPLAEVITEHEELKGKIRGSREEAERVRKQLADYAAQYTDRRSLLLATAEAAGREKKLKEKLALRAPLPEGVRNSTALIAAYQGREEEKRRLDKELTDLKVAAAGLTASLPEETEEALEERLQETDVRLEETKRAASAIARIRELAGELLEDIDQDTFTDLKKDVEELVGKLTGRRYQKVAMKGSLPRGLVRNDGQILPPDLLSVGTRDELALAVRLAMAKRFLKKGGGFLLLDDPLVDFDPRRQEAAAGLLKDFAVETQLLVFTCQPRHAELLSDRQVRLD